jgi:hypothetical protein
MSMSPSNRLQGTLSVALGELALERIVALLDLVPLAETFLEMSVTTSD